MNSRDGIILLSSLITLCVASVLAIAFLSIISSSILITTKNINFTKAFYVAEAGIADAAGYNEDVKITRPFGGGSYVLGVKVLEDGSRKIVSKGIYKDAERVISINIIKQKDKLKVTNWREA